MLVTFYKTSLTFLKILLNLFESLGLNQPNTPYMHHPTVGAKVKSERIGPGLSFKKAQLCAIERELGSNQAFQIQS